MCEHADVFWRAPLLRNIWYDSLNHWDFVFIVLTANSPANPVEKCVLHFKYFLLLCGFSFTLLYCLLFFTIVAKNLAVFLFYYAAFSWTAKIFSHSPLNMINPRPVQYNFYHCGFTCDFTMDF